MNEKRKFSERAKEWWVDHRDSVKAGAAVGLFGLVGFGYGFVTGTVVTDVKWINGICNYARTRDGGATM